MTLAVPVVFLVLPVTVLFAEGLNCNICVRAVLDGPHVTREPSPPRGAIPLAQCPPASSSGCSPARA